MNNWRHAVSLTSGQTLSRSRRLQQPGRQLLQRERGTLRPHGRRSGRSLCAPLGDRRVALRSPAHNSCIIGEASRWPLQSSSNKCIGWSASVKSHHPVSYLDVYGARRRSHRICRCACRRWTNHTRMLCSQGLPSGQPALARPAYGPQDRGTQHLVKSTPIMIKRPKGP